MGRKRVLDLTNSRAGYTNWRGCGPDTGCDSTDMKTIGPTFQSELLECKYTVPLMRTSVPRTQPLEPAGQADCNSYNPVRTRNGDPLKVEHSIAQSPQSYRVVRPNGHSRWGDMANNTTKWNSVQHTWAVHERRMEQTSNGRAFSAPAADSRLDGFYETDQLHKMTVSTAQARGLGRRYKILQCKLPRTDVVHNNRTHLGPGCHDWHHSDDFCRKSSHRQQFGKHCFERFELQGLDVPGPGHCDAHVAKDALRRNRSFKISRVARNTSLAKKGQEHVLPAGCGPWHDVERAWSRGVKINPEATARKLPGGLGQRTDAGKPAPVPDATSPPTQG